MNNNHDISPICLMVNLALSTLVLNISYHEINNIQSNIIEHNSFYQEFNFVFGMITMILMILNFMIVNLIIFGNMPGGV